MEEMTDTKSAGSIASTSNFMGTYYWVWGLKCQIGISKFDKVKLKAVIIEG